MFWVSNKKGEGAQTKGIIVTKMSNRFNLFQIGH